MPQALREKKRWRAIRNLVMPAEALIIEGRYLDDKDRTLWRTAKNQTVPEETIVESGSVFEVELTRRHEKVWLEIEAIATLPAGEQLHFNLEDLFGAEGAALLRASDIWTLEDVAVEKEGAVPYTELSEAGESFISMRELLMGLCNNDKAQVDEWLREAQRAVGMNPESLTPANEKKMPRQGDESDTLVKEQ